MIDIRFWEEATSNELWDCTPNKAVSYYDTKTIKFKGVPLKLTFRDLGHTIQTIIEWNGVDVSARGGRWCDVIDWVMSKKERIEEDKREKKRKKEGEALKDVDKEVERWLRERESEGS